MQTILLILFCLFGTSSAYPLTAMPHQELVLKIKPSPSKVSQKKIRWKQVFRPIKLFKKKIRFWMWWTLGIAALMSLIFLIADRQGDAEGDIFYFFAGLFLLSSLTFVLSLLLIPIIIIIRIFQELAWHKRYQRCFK